MAGRFDDIVSASDEPEMAIGIPHRETAGKVPAIGKAFRVVLGFVEVSSHPGAARS